MFFMKMVLMVNERVKVMRVITHGMRGLGFLHRVGGNENADSEPPNRRFRKIYCLRAARAASLNSSNDLIHK